MVLEAPHCVQSLSVDLKVGGNGFNDFWEKAGTLSYFTIINLEISFSCSFGKKKNIRHSLDVYYRGIKLVALIFVFFLGVQNFIF